MEGYAAALWEAGQSEATISLRLTKLIDALNALDPQATADLSSVARFARSLRQRLTDDRAHELAFGVSARDLLGLGHELMAEGDALAARARARKGLRGAARYRDGLLIAVQALVLLRPAALLSLELGVTAIRAADGWRLVVPSGRDKSSRRRDVPVAADLTPALDRYVEVHRPRLAAQANGAAPTAFWLSDRGLPLSARAAWRAVTEPAALRLGVAPSIHRYRHIATSDVAISAPEMLGVMPGVLGHADHRPLVEHYDTATRTIANQAYASSIERERGEAASSFLRRHRRTTSESHGDR